MRSVTVALRGPSASSAISPTTPPGPTSSTTRPPRSTFSRPSRTTIISLPHSFNRTPLIAAAKLINPDVKVFVRAHYLREREDLEQAGADGVIYEEAEAAVALSRQVLFDTGADAETVKRETTRIRQRFMTGPAGAT